MQAIDLGCGSSKRDGFIGVDCLNLSGVDIVHNLQSFPYPFEDNSIDEIWMDQVLEHLQNPLRVLEELYRICKNGAKVTIGVPYFRGFYACIDPTHVNYFSVQWFNYFNPNHTFHTKYRYSNIKFRIEKIEFDREFKCSKIGFIHRFMLRIANKNPEFYEESYHTYIL